MPKVLKMANEKKTQQERNKLFRNTPPLKWCGTKGCDTNPKNVDCANNMYMGGYDKGLTKCDSEYSSEFVQSTHCTLFGPDRKRQCSRLDVSNPVFNQLETQYKTAIDKKETPSEDLLEDIDLCCSADADLDKCGNLYDGYNNNEQICKSFLKTTCMQNLDKLNTPICRKWCIENERLCNRNIVAEFCQNKNIKPDDRKYWPICGCYYNEEFYEKLRQNLAKSYNIPASLLSGSKSCYFPGCKDNKMNPAPDDEISKCDKVNLMQCIQDIKIIGDNLTLNKGSIEQSADCSTSISAFKKQTNGCATDNDCAEGVKCNKVSGLCIPLTSKPCTETKECDSGFTCQSNFCISSSGSDSATGSKSKVPKDGLCAITSECESGLKCILKKCGIEEPTSFNLPLIIGLSVGGLVLLLIIAGVLFKMKSSNSSSTATSTVSS